MILKFIWKRKGAKVAKVTLQKKKEVLPPYFKIYHKSTVIKTQYQLQDFKKLIHETE